MVSPLNCDLFTNILLTISEYEKSIEILRRILVEQVDFHPYLLFRFIDIDNKQFINEHDMIKLLKNHSILPSPLEARMFINFYDRDLDGKLSFNEFLNIILTEKEKEAIEISSFYTKSPSNIGYETEYSLVRIIEKEISLVKNINKIMHSLTFRNDFNLVDLFSLLDSNNLNFLSPNNFKNFFYNNGINCQDHELKAIFRRFDIDKDGKVLFWEFKRILSVKSEEIDKTNRNSGFRETNSINSLDVPNENLSSILQKNPLNDSTKLTNLSNLYKTPQYYLKNSISIKNDTKFLSESYNKSFISFTSSQTQFFKKDFVTLEEQSFIEFLKDLIDIENDLEKIRSDLAKKEDFTLQDAYSIFEVNKKGCITTNDLMFSLKIFSVSSDSEELEFFIKNHAYENHKKKDVFTYNEFCRILVPQNEEDQKMLKMRVPISVSINKLNKYEIFSQETRSIFTELFLKLLLSEKNVEHWRKKLNVLKGFNIREIFNKLDRFQKNYIIYDDLMYYLRKNNAEFNQFSLSLLFNRFDKDSDGRIIYHEFTEEVYPKSNEFLY